MTSRLNAACVKRGKSCISRVIGAALFRLFILRRTPDPRPTMLCLLGACLRRIAAAVNRRRADVASPGAAYGGGGYLRDAMHSA